MSSWDRTKLCRSVALFAFVGAAWLPVGAGAFAQPSDTAPPVITHEPVQRAALGKPITIRVKIEDESAIFAPSAQVRLAGKTEFDTIDLKPSGDGRYEAVIPAEQGTGSLEYFIEAFDEHGNGPARAGSPEAPLVISIVEPKVVPPPKVVAPVAPAPGVPEAPPPGKDGSDRKKKAGLLGAWWFWSLVGVAAAGGATAVFLATRPGGGPDLVTVQVTGPDPVGRL